MNGSRVVQVRVRTEKHWPHDALTDAGLKAPDDVHLGGGAVVEDDFA